MSRLVKQIERLMYQEECVVVPKIGAFIKHTHPAHEDESKALLYPGRDELTFNALLDQNDGLLVQAYSKAYSFGYKRALALLEQDIEEALTQLQNRGVWQVGSIGKLTKDRHGGQTLFTPNPDHPFSIDYYGLMPVASLPRLSSTASTDQPKAEKDIVYLPINLRYVRYGAAAAIVAGALFLIPWQRLASPSKPNSGTEYQAGFLAPAKQTTVASDQVALSAPLPETTEVPETADIAPAEVTETTLQTIEGLPLYETPTGEERYYIVISTLSAHEGVEKFIAENRDYVTFDNAGILRSPSGMYRIFADHFTTKDAAQLGLNELIKDPRYASAWVYKSK